MITLKNLINVRKTNLNFIDFVRSHCATFNGIFEEKGDLVDVSIDAQIDLTRFVPPLYFVHQSVGWTSTGIHSVYVFDKTVIENYFRYQIANLESLRLSKSEMLTILEVEITKDVLTQ